MLEQQELGFVDVVRFIVRGLLPALAVATLAAVTAFAVSQVIPARFAADARLLVAAPSEGLRELTGINAAISTLDSLTYQELARSEGVILEALRELGYEAPRLEQVDELLDRIKVSTDEGRTSSIITVTVSAANADVASAEANAIARSMLAWETRRARSLLERTTASLNSQVIAIASALTELRSSTEPDQLEISALEQLLEAQRNRLLLVRSAPADGLGSLAVFQFSLGPAPQVAPRPLLYSALAFIAGLVAAYAALILVAASSGRIDTLDDLARTAKAPVLAVIPQGAFGRKPEKSQKGRKALGFLITKLLLLSDGRPHRFLISALDESGDSRALSLGVARAFAAAGEHTLLIISDLRQPTSPFVFEGQRIPIPLPGLERILTEPEQPFQLARMNIAGSQLDFLAPLAGAADGSALLARGLPVFLQGLRQNYSVVVVDAAPMAAAPDALALLPEIEDFLLVVSFPTLRKRALKDVVDALASVGHAITGVVVVDAPRFWLRSAS